MATPDAPLRIALQVTPATEITGGMPATHTFGPFHVDSAAQQDITLHRAISVFGLVEWNGLPMGVSADVRFSRIDTGELAAVPRVTREASTLAMPAEAADGNPANYGVRVLTGRDYEVTVTPTGEAAALLPPLRMTVPVPTFMGPADFLRLDFKYPTDLTMVHGVIVDRDEVPPRQPLQVQAVEVETSRVVSSTAITDAAGEFSLHIDPGAGAWVFRISGGPDAPLQPTMLADPEYFFPDAEGFVRILVPTITPVSYQGPVEPKSQPGTPVPGTVLTFRSTDVYDDTTGVTSSFRTTATTDARGRYTVDILPGTYDVTVTPPDEIHTPGSDSPTPSPLGVLVEEDLEIRLPADGGELLGQTFELPQRANTGGQVLTSDGRPVTGALVSAVALGRPGVTPAASYNRSADEMTDATGQFNMRLDFGTYDLAIKPVGESGFSWLVAPGLSFASTEPFTPTYELAAPVPVSGSVISADVTAPTVAGAEVRAWALIEEEDGTTRAVQIGRTMTREDGTYTLLLPSRL